MAASRPSPASSSGVDVFSSEFIVAPEMTAKVDIE
jgi:hypothetical protein